MTLGRISTAETFRSAINSVTDTQLQLDRIQQQLASGKKILTPADDPVASAQIAGLRTSLQRLETYQQNTTRAEGTLAFQDSALEGAQDVLLRARDLVIQAGNPALNESDLVTLGKEIEGLIDRLVSIGNTQNADGEYLFGGYTSSTQPYELAGGVVTEIRPRDVGKSTLRPALLCRSTTQPPVFLMQSPATVGSRCSPMRPIRELE